jgi:Flp pilus assembly pilin Flp
MTSGRTFPNVMRVAAPFDQPAHLYPPRGGESNVSSFFKSLPALSKRDDGQTMAEYGVVLAVITLAVVVALAALSGAISDALDAVTGVL